MKAYLVTTGALWTLFAVMHGVMAIRERAQLTTDPGGFLGMAALGLLATGLSVWAWCLLGRQIRR